jgi:aspartate/methionine/tyrosine aminotransferase
MKSQGTAENKLMSNELSEKLNNDGILEAHNDELLYGDFSGSIQLRSEIARLVNRRFGLPTQLSINQDMVLVANGAGSIINILAQVLADQNDVIMIPSPVYGAFVSDLSSTAQVETVFVPGELSQPSLESFDLIYNDAIKNGKNVRAIILTNPGNPSTSFLNFSLKLILMFK